MLQILRQYADGDFLVTEYTKDGITVSHTMRTPIGADNEEEIPVSKNPLIQAQEDIVVVNTNITNIKKQNASTMLSLVRQNNDLQIKIAERDTLLENVKLQNSTLMLLLARNGIN